MQYIDIPKQIIFNKQKIAIIKTPGHTPGSVCYLLGNRLFSGDTLFYRSIGRTDLLGGDMTILQNSLQKLAKLSNELEVLPGHGSTTTIAQEKQYGYL